MGPNKDVVTIHLELFVSGNPISIQSFLNHQKEPWFSKRLSPPSDLQGYECNPYRVHSYVHFWHFLLLLTLPVTVRPTSFALPGPDTHHLIQNEPARDRLAEVSSQSGWDGFPLASFLRSPLISPSPPPTNKLLRILSWYSIHIPIRRWLLLVIDWIWITEGKK